MDEPIFNSDLTMKQIKKNFEDMDFFSGIMKDAPDSRSKYNKRGSVNDMCPKIPGVQYWGVHIKISTLPLLLYLPEIFKHWDLAGSRDRITE